MAKLISSGTVSLDGFMADPDGNYDWSIPGDEVLAYITWRERSIGTYLYGRRMYEEMVEWETADQQPGQDPLIVDFAGMWQATKKLSTHAPSAQLQQIVPKSNKHSTSKKSNT